MQHLKKRSHQIPISRASKQLANSAHCSWQTAVPCPVRSDAYSITCTTGPRRAGWPLTACDELINHGHLLNSCSCTIINGSADWAVQQTGSRGSSTCWSSNPALQKAPASARQLTGEITESCPKLPSSLLFGVAEWLPAPLWGSNSLPQGLPRWHGLPLKDSPSTNYFFHGGMLWSDWHQSIPVPCST